jgi:hypothetical protein
MTSQKTQKLLSLFSWISGILVSLTVGYALINGPLTLPEPFGGFLISNIIGILIVVTTILSLIFSFFRK